MTVPHQDPDVPRPKIVGLRDDGTVYVLAALDGHAPAIHTVALATGSVRSVWEPEHDVASAVIVGGEVVWGATDTDRWRWVRGPDSGAHERLEAHFPDGASMPRCDRAGQWCIVRSWAPHVGRRTHLWDRAADRVVDLSSDGPDGTPFRPMRSAMVPSRDGLRLAVHVTTPDPDRFGVGPWPGVVVVHGGSKERDRHAFRADHQWLAQHGYSAVSVNHRGTPGFGEAFLRAGDGARGEAIQRDLEDGLDWAIAQGWVDGERVAISGERLGGYEALRAVTSGSRYRCAIANGAPGALVRRVPGGGLSYPRYGTPGQRRRRAPDRAVGRLAVPVLLFHSESDPLVPVGQIRPFVDRALAAGKDVRLHVVAPGDVRRPEVIEHNEERVAEMSVAFLQECLRD